MSDQIEEKLDQVLEMLARLRPAFRKLDLEGPDDSIQLILPEELAYIITKSEDDRRRRPPGAPPPPSTLSDDDSLVAYTIAGKTYRSYRSLSYFTERLQGLPGFLETHRSYLANLNRISRVKTTNTGREVFYENVDLPAEISKDHVKEFEAYLGL